MRRYGSCIRTSVPRMVTRPITIRLSHYKPLVRYSSALQYAQPSPFLRTWLRYRFGQRRMVASGKQSSTADERLRCQAVKIQYLPIEDVEPLEHYCAGGYYPAHIGERISHYQIVHKLGFGTFSTTWLARDEKSATYVAIKIICADVDAKTETAILRGLLDSPPGHDGSPGKHYVRPILDSLEISGPDIEGQRGLHKCLVTPVARMSISEAREASVKRVFQPLVARAIVAQLIQAVAFLHSRGVVHSDLHAGNIMLQLADNIDDMTTEQLYDNYGEPEAVPITRSDGGSLDVWVPSHGIPPVWFGDESENVDLAESGISLIDFGESFCPESSPRFFSPIPNALRAPELFLCPSSPVSYPADIWALACSIFAILGQRELFDTWFPDPDHVLAEHVDTLGRLPPRMWAGWDKRSDFFSDDLQRVDGAPRNTLDLRCEYSIQEPRRRHGMAEMEEEEKRALLALLSSMLAFVPESRPSIEQVVRSEWVVKWANPALTKAHKISA